ncbi:MAG: M56 family metallopeptidase [Acidobacteriota bacterium]|nr:M56 family metallopeptidase [Acidobacteriota bacterium]
MMMWFTLNACLSVLVLAVMASLRTAPAKIRLWPAVIALTAWCLPVQMLRFEAPVTATPLTFLPAVVGTGPDVTVASPQAVNWGLWLLACVLGFGLMRFAVDLHANCRRRASMLCESYPAPHLARLLPKSLQRRAPHIRVWPGHAGAAVSGLLRPCIWVGDSHLETPELAGVLCHEAVHASRRDNLVLGWVTFLERLFWWNPLARLLAANARLDLERSCDETCSNLLTPKQYRADLAALLLADHGFLPGTRLAAGLGGPVRSNMLRIQSLERRSEMKCRHIVSLLLLTTASLALFAGNQDKVIPEPAQADVLDVGKVDRVPIFTKKVTPKYPKAAVKDKVSGYVILEGILRGDGSIDDIEIKKSKPEGYGMGKAAVTAFKHWEFVPAEHQGKTVDVRMHVKIDFVLIKSEAEGEQQ